ncbi:MAG: hypothetical protein J6N49_03975 [Alphaproteobacteria bacterium]|nr:hypothetical protein [Alphaproteobacteria bacterium]
MACACVSASAQEFFKVESVQQTGKSFFVLAGNDKAVQVSVVVYKLVKKSPKDYVVAYCECEEENFLTVAHKRDIKRMVSEVDSVGFGATEETYKLFFKDGTSYESTDEDLLAVQPGQKVEFTSILGLTQNFWRHRTVPRDTPVSKEVDVFKKTTPNAE